MTEACVLGRQGGRGAGRLALAVPVAARSGPGDRGSAAASPAAERRHWERIPVTIPLFVRAVADGRRVLEFANVLNISAGGALLAVRSYVRHPTKVSLEIPAAPVAETAALPASARLIEARVLRVQSAERSFLWAVRFTRPLAAAARRSRAAAPRRPRTAPATAVNGKKSPFPNPPRPAN